MESSRRRQRGQSTANNSHWGVSFIALLLVLISGLMCFLILTTVKQSVKLSSIHSQLIKMEQLQPSSGEQAATQSTTPIQSTGSSTIPEVNQEQGEGIPSPEASGVYVVKAGDSLSSIAEQLGTSVERLMSDNGLSSSIIQIGQELTH